MGQTRVESVLVEGYKVENTSRTHTWISDEPIEIEGTDLGPKPTELLLSSLASCKIITVQMYAARKGWDIESIRIGLAIVGKEEKTIVEKSIHIEGNLDEKQLNRLVEISNRCPVVKMLSNSIEFKHV